MKKYYFLILLIAFKAFGLPIIGPYAPTLTRQQIMLRKHILYMDFREIWDPKNKKWLTPKMANWYTTLLSIWEIYYGFENVFTIRASFKINYGHQEVFNSKKSIKTGDVIIDAKYSLYNPARELEYAGVVHPEFTLISGIRIPTGAQENTPNPITRWVGNGSGDVEIGGAVRLGNSIGAIHASIVYWHKGLIGGEREAELDYNFTIESPRLFEKNYLLFLLELDGSKIGTHYLFQVCPGIQYGLTYGRGIRVEREVEHEIRFEASVLIPVEAEGGLRYKFAPFGGISWTF
jgi:hypothetical protein